MSYLLAKNGVSDWYIVVDRDADETTRYAADELNKYLYAATGALIPYYSNITARLGPELKLGRNTRPDGEDALIDEASLGDEGFCIKTTGENILITGHTSRGTLYGVYAFLEQFCGIRWFTKDVTRIPKHPILELPDIELTQAPAFESRDSYWREAFDGDFAVHNRINTGKADISPRQGGKLNFFNSAHASYDLVPPSKYFATHPEYFAEVEGERLAERSQLCMTNPDVAEIAAAQVIKWKEENPYCSVFSIAQEDNNRHCTCARCRALSDAEGSPSASVLLFSNRVAELVTKKYPDVLLHTFAYQWSRKPPKTIRAHKNLIVRLCNIECSFSKPLMWYRTEAPDSTEARFTDDIKRWAELCQRLYVWDYCTNFHHYLMPFPNLASLQENIRLFRSFGVRGLLEQGNFSHGGGGAMAELQAYLQARLMWNPELDLELEISEFLSGVYGAGAPYLKRYLERMQAAVSPYELRIKDTADMPYLTDALLNECDALFAAAELSAENKAVRERVARAHLSIEYTRLVRLPLDVPGRDAMVDGFIDRIKAYGITELTERAHLEYSRAKMKAFRYNKDREGFQRIYYRM